MRRFGPEANPCLARDSSSRSTSWGTFWVSTNIGHVDFEEWFRKSALFLYSNPPSAKPLFIFLLLTNKFSKSFVKKLAHQINDQQMNFTAVPSTDKVQKKALIVFFCEFVAHIVNSSCGWRVQRIFIPDLYRGTEIKVTVLYVTKNRHNERQMII